VRLGTLLGRTWSGIAGTTARQPTPAALFRQADRCRNEARYDDAAQLLAEGLALAPDSSVGQLLSAYLHVAARDMTAARAAFNRVLALDPYHPRALLGLARIALEEQDWPGAQALLDRALEYYVDFPEAQALHDMVASWAAGAPAAAPTPAAVPPDDVELSSAVRDLVMARTDGTLILKRTDEERGELLVQHATQVYRMASATLARAGLGALHRGAIDTGSEMSFLLHDADRLLSAALDGHVELGAGLSQLGRLWPKLAVKA